MTTKNTIIAFSRKDLDDILSARLDMKIKATDDQWNQVFDNIHRNDDIWNDIDDAVNSSVSILINNFINS